MRLTINDIAPDFLADNVTTLAGPLGPHAVLAALIVLASLLSQGLDGAPAVVLLAPVVLEMADKLDMAVISVGGISTLTTSYRTGYLSEADRRSLVEAGAVGDVLYNFIGEDGALVDHEVNARAIAVSLDRLRRTPERVLISGGKDKLVALAASIRNLKPTTLITDEQSALWLAGRSA